MDRTPPPFFRQGPSAHVRLAVFSLLALALLVVDSRYGALTTLRQGMATLLYPLQRTLLVPRDAFTLVSEYVGEVTRLRAENAELRRLETANAKTLLQAEQLADENAQLRRLLGAREQVAVRSSLDDLSMMQDQNLVGAHDCAQPVRHGDRRPPLHQDGEGRLDLGLDLAVHRAGGLVEEQQVRIGGDRPSEG